MLILFYNIVIIIIIRILTLTIYIIFYLLLNKFSSLFLLENHNIEILTLIYFFNYSFSFIENFIFN